MVKKILDLKKKWGRKSKFNDDENETFFPLIQKIVYEPKAYKEEIEQAIKVFKIKNHNLNFIFNFLF